MRNFTVAILPMPHVSSDNRMMTLKRESILNMLIKFIVGKAHKLSSAIITHVLTFSGLYYTLQRKKINCQREYGWRELRGLEPTPCTRWLDQGV